LYKNISDVKNKENNCSKVDIMTDIISAAEKFSSENDVTEMKTPRGFFKRLKFCVRTVSVYIRSRERSGVSNVYGERNFLSGVKSASTDLISEKRMSVRGDVPFSYAMMSAYLAAVDMKIGNATLCEFIATVSRKHDFLICEMLLLRDCCIAALADKFADGDESVKAECIRAFMALEAVNFDDIFHKYTKVHHIFSLEKAGVFENCSRDTELYYDMRLLERCGDDEMGAARDIVRRADVDGEHVGKYLLGQNNDVGKAYFWLVFVLTAFIFSIIVYVSNAVISLMALPLAYMLAKGISISFFERNHSFLPSLSKGDELENARCVISVTTLLCGERADREIFDNIEDFYLQNSGKNYTFAVLGDLKEADRKHISSDAAVIRYASSRINALNEKYGAHFALFIRRRRFAVCERKYLGWERKRGAVLELCRYIKGVDGSFETVIGGDAVRGADYLLTLDSDTKPGISSVRRMLGIMLHPQNRAVVDNDRRTVVGGYAVLQPKMAVSLFSANKSAFAALTGGGGGTDRYSSFSFDLYQDVFGRGIFCGKGMIDVAAFLAVCDGVFPKERILSHDLLEGAIARTAVSERTVMTDGTPRTAPAYFSRLERWIRGDLQTITYLGKKVKNEDGTVIENPVSPLSRYQIFDNIVRESAPLFCVLLIFLCSYYNSYYALFVLGYIFLPLIKSIIVLLIGSERKTLYHIKTVFARSLASTAFEVFSLASFAGTFAKATVNVIYSAVFSKRGFLSWTTAAEMEHGRKNGIVHHVASMWYSVVIGAAALVLPPPASIIGALWMLFPLVTYALGRERSERTFMSPEVEEKIRNYAADMWKFFADNVGDQTNWLPPDNVQLSPVNVTAMRTSPTNIGLYFLILLVARDFGFISTDELCTRATNALNSLEKMLRWNGHLYNWYGLDTLNVIGVPFVSSVDSGNFVTSLVAFCEGIKEYASENVNLIYVKNRAEKMIFEADFDKLIDKNRGFLSVGYNASLGKLSESCYDMLMSEARTTAYFMESTHASPEGYYRKLGRTLLSRRFSIGAASWSGTAFEFFMPSLLMPEPKNSFSDLALKYAFNRQRDGAVRVAGKGFSVFGVSESCYFEFDHDMNYQYSAFGLDSLSLDPQTKQESVISPYSSFLMIKRAPTRVISNLEKLKGVGMYGKYGFYEALDVEKTRVGNGYAVIKSFMSHHLGMSMIAAANAVFDDVFVARFMRNPLMRSCAELLGERTPSGAGVSRRRVKIRTPKAVIPTVYSDSKKSEKLPPTLISPSCAMLSNNKTRVVAASSGQLALYDGSDLLAAAPFEKYSLGGGLSVYAHFDGGCVSAVPLGYVSDGFDSEFGFEYNDREIVYRSSHKKDGKKIDFDMTVALRSDAEIIGITCKLSGDVQNADVSIYFEPVIDEKNAYMSHKSFSNLFIESKYYADENAVVFRRRPRSEGRSEKYLGIVSDPPLFDGDFETRRDKILPLCYGASDIAGVRVDIKEKKRTGADIIPACFVSVRAGIKSKTVSFKLGYSHNCDDLLYLLSQKNGFSNADIGELQRAASGADDRVAELERLLLVRMMFGSGKRSGGSGLASALSKKPVYQQNLWRHGISGDMNIVSAVIKSGSDEEFTRLYELLRLFKYSCIRGLRYDLVLIYSESDKYNAPVLTKIKNAVGAVGLGGFVGCNGGVFIIDGSECSDGERFVLCECATELFDLSIPNAFSAADKYYVNIPKSIENQIKKGAEKRVLPSPLPQKYAKGTAVGRGILNDSGFTVVKNGSAPPWAHIVSSRGFGTVLSENSLGFTFFSNSALGKITPHYADNMTEDGGEQLILRIYRSDDASKFDDYDAAACAKYAHFDDGTAEYIGTVKDVDYSVSVDVCSRFPTKRVKARISSQKPMFADVIYRVKPCLNAVSAMNHIAVTADDARGSVAFSPMLVAGRRAVRGLIALCGGKPHVYTDEAALRSDGKIFGGEGICAVGDKIDGSKDHVSTFLIAAIQTDAAEKYVFGELIPNIDEVPRSALGVVTPLVGTAKSEIDKSINFWLPYQTEMSRLFARSGFYQVGGAYGFRDQLQDIISMIPYAPNLAREQLLRAASHQYTDGSVMHWWHNFGYPHAGIRSRCSDDSVWLAYALCEYVLKTGDADILGVKTPYLSSPSLNDVEYERYEAAPFSDADDTVFIHALRGLERSFKTGAHGLSLIGTGDWNDGMNNVGRRGKGESVWLAFFSAITAKKLADVCGKSGMYDDASYLAAESKRLVAAADGAFNGLWYIRGYYDDGTPLGDISSDECKVDIMPQAFAAIAASEVDSALCGHAKTALKNASDILLDRENGVFRLLWPPFDNGDGSPGYIKGYLPGIRENGGQYTHAAVFAALGMLRLGMNREGAELLFTINPLMRKSPSYKVEPYVLAGDVYSEPSNVGRGGWSWYTGAAGWYRTVFIEELCGYRRTPNGFSVHPRFSEAFDSFTLEVRQNDTVYVIKASLSERDFIALDGREWKNEFPFDGGTHTAEIFSTVKGFEQLVSNENIDFSGSL